MLKAVIFDLDGVLVDSEGVGLSIARAITASAGITVSEEDMSRFVGMTDREFYEFLGSRYPLFDIQSAAAQHELKYQGVLNDLPIIHQSVAFVKECARNGLRLALVTGSTRVEATTLLCRMGIHDLFASIVTADDLRVGKPDPEGYRTAVRRLGVQESQAVVIEDSDPGIVAARRAHVRVLAIRHSTPVLQTFAEADLVVDDLSQLSVEALHRLVHPSALQTASDGALELHSFGRKLRELIRADDVASDHAWLSLSLASPLDWRYQFVRGEPVLGAVLDEWLGSSVVKGLIAMRLLKEQGEELQLRGCCVTPLGIPLIIPERPTRQASGQWRSTHVYLDSSSIEYVKTVERAVKSWQGLSVLEIGCGSGLFLVRAGLGSARRLVGIDVDAASVKTTRSNLTLAGIGSFSVIESDMFANMESLQEEFDVVAFHPPYRIVPSELNYPNPIQRVGVGRYGLDLVYRFIKSVRPYLATRGRSYVFLQTPEGRNLSMYKDLCERMARIGLTVLDKDPISYSTIDDVARGVGDKFPSAASSAAQQTANYYRTLGIEYFATRLMMAER